MEYSAGQYIESYRDIKTLSSMELCSTIISSISIGIFDKLYNVYISKYLVLLKFQ